MAKTSELRRFFALALVLCFIRWASSASVTLKGNTTQIIVQNDWSFRIEVIYTNKTTGQIETLPNFHVSWIFQYIGEYNGTNFVDQKGLTHGSPEALSNYSLADAISSSYTTDYEESLPLGAKLRGIMQTARLPNGANITAIYSQADAPTYVNIDGWRVDLNLGEFKLTYKVDNWPKAPVYNEVLWPKGRGVFIQSLHDVQFMPKPEPFYIFDRNSWPANFVYYNLTAPGNYVDPAVQPTISPDFYEATYTTYYDKRLSACDVHWIRTSRSCDTATGSCAWKELQFFRATNADTIAAAFVVFSNFDSPPAVLNVTFPVFAALSLGNDDFAEWDPSFDILFNNPEDPGSQDLVQAQAGLIAGVVVAVAAVCIAAVAVIAFRHKIFPFLSRGSSESSTIHLKAADEPAETPKQGRSTWREAKPGH